MVGDFFRTMELNLQLLTLGWLVSFTGLNKAGYYWFYGRPPVPEKDACASSKSVIYRLSINTSITQKWAASRFLLSFVNMVTVIDMKQGWTVCPRDNAHGRCGHKCMTSSLLYKPEAVSSKVSTQTGWPSVHWMIDWLLSYLTSSYQLLWMAIYQR